MEILQLDKVSIDFVETVEELQRKFQTLARSVKYVIVMELERV